ncbi:MAG: hypothetical protein KC418_18700 [Anaerolineales bacterium]|nr:hypothetical protein [Anaerolineales bacterium]
MRKSLLPLFDANRSIPLYLLGTVTLTLIIEFAIDFANSPSEWKASQTLTVVAVVCILIALGISWYHNRPKRVYLLEERKPGKRKGLIVLVSQYKASAPAAIQYHLESMTDCWLISTPQSTTVAAEIASDFSENRQVRFHYGSNYEVLFDDAASTNRVAKRIIFEELASLNLQPNDLIGDITGGSKPMTAGLVFACREREIPLQYIVAEKDETGRAKPGAFGEPIKLDLSFVPPQE